jgi:hypothetical protein
VILINSMQLGKEAYVHPYNMLRELAMQAKFEASWKGVEKNCKKTQILNYSVKEELEQFSPKNKWMLKIHSL